jgi:hypothetical protein
MIFRYLAVALLFAQILQAQGVDNQAAQPSEDAPPQAETPSDPYKTLEMASGAAHQRFREQLTVFRGEIARSCNNERFKRERQRVVDALREYEKRESAYLDARINRQKTILDTLQVMQPESAPPAVDLGQVRSDLSKARQDLVNDEERYKRKPSPSLEKAIAAEKDGIARLEEIMRLNDEERLLDEKTKSDFDEAVRLQGIYLKEEETGLLLLQEETSNWTQYLTSLAAGRILACTRGENIGLDRPRLGATPAPQK